MSWLDRAWLIAFVVILLVLLSVYCGARININRFSLHGVYRNRLARAFIGTARPPEERKPDAYTRFDPATICACRICIRARNSAAFCSRW